MKKQLLIVADDYGVHDAIDNGIHHCIDAGVIDCTAVIITHEESEFRLQKLITNYAEEIQKGKFIVGLHLNLNVGGPINVINPFEPGSEKNKAFTDFLNLISSKPLGGSDHDRVFRHRKVKPIVKIIKQLEDDYLDFLEAEMIAQFDKFRSIVGRYPDHVSSHNGVFQGTEKIYRMYSKFCKDNAIRMRCPTLMIFDPEKGDEWKNNPSQNLFPAFLFNLVTHNPVGEGSLEKGAKIVLDWTRDKLKTQFEADRTTGLVSTHYCVEHFFRNGKHARLRKIMDKIRNDQMKNHYELIVHPIHYDDIKECENFPAGIDNLKGLLRDRKDERDVLISESIRDAMNIRHIIPIKFPPRPLVEEELA